MKPPSPQTTIRLIIKGCKSPLNRKSSKQELHLPPDFTVLYERALRSEVFHIPVNLLLSPPIMVLSKVTLDPTCQPLALSLSQLVIATQAQNRSTHLLDYLVDRISPQF